MGGGWVGVDPDFNLKTNNKNLQEIFSSCYSRAKWSMMMMMMHLRCSQLQIQGLVVQWTDGSRTLFQTACSSSMRKNYLLQVNLQWNNTGGMTLGAWGKNSCPEFAAMQRWGFRDMGAFQEVKNCFKVCNGIHHCQRNERTFGAWFQEEKNSQSLLQCNSGRTLGCCCCCSRFRV